MSVIGIFVTSYFVFFCAVQMMLADAINNMIVFLLTADILEVPGFTFSNKNCQGIVQNFVEALSHSAGLLHKTSDQQ